MRPLLALVRSTFRLFFSDLRLVADDGRLRIQLDKTCSKVEVAPDGDHLASSDLMAIRSDLKVLLGQHEGTRKTLRHIAAVESLLKRNGLDVIDSLPLNVLTRAQDQLDALTKGSSTNSAALVYLKAILQVAALKREASDRHPNPAFQFLSDFNNLDKVVVDTVTFSDFHDALKESPGSVSGSAIRKERPPPLFHPALSLQDRTSR